MTDWLQLLAGGSGVGVPVLGLVLWGKLLPSWVVNKASAATETAHESAIAALVASHQRELTSRAQAHASEVEALKTQHQDALTVRDRENAYLAQQHQHEREAKDVERSRADASADRVYVLATEFGANHLKLLGAVREAAGQQQSG